jgi:radical SAM protein with 4Fe4S-binding SPASM domain
MTVIESRNLEKLLLGWHMFISGQFHMRGVLNLASNLLAAYRKHPPKNYPPLAMIDPTNACNLRCTSCVLTIGEHPLPPGYMNISNFRRLVNEIRGHTLLVALYNSGEPFINPFMFEMIEYLSANQVASVTSTNGHFFTTDERAERLVKSGLTMVIFSLSGASQTVYEQYHARGNFQRLKAGIARVVAAKKRLGSRTPLIKLRFLLFDHNRGDIDQMKRLAEEVGADLIDLRDGDYVLSRSQEPELSSPPITALSPLSQASQAPQQGGKVCLWPWLISVVHWDGTVVPCCHLLAKLPDMGNAFSTGGMRDVWWGSGLRSYRRLMARGKNHIEGCRQCEAAVGFQDRQQSGNRRIYFRH